MRENRQHGSEGGEGESPFRPLFMLAVEAQVGGQQALLGRVQGVAPTPEVQEQPAQIQGGDDLLEIRAKEPAGRDVFGGGKRLTLVAPKRREREHRKVRTFHQSNANGCLACRLPGDPGLGVQLLGEVDALNEVVALLQINTTTALAQRMESG